MIEKANEKTISKAIKILKRGGIIAFPTETVYGIGCLTEKNDALKKIFELKKRDKKPLQLLFPYKNMVKDYGTIKNMLELKIIKKCMPGAITILLEKNKKLQETITQGSTYIGARIPNNKVIQNLLLQLDMPLAATSANISGEKDLLSAESVRQVFGDQIDLIIDGGICKNEQPSTVIKVEGHEIIIKRQGALTKEDILKQIKN